MLSPGSQAPELVLEDQDGNLFRLSSLRGKGPVVLFFYPKDETPVCTREACGFRDLHNAFTTHGATVIGISADRPASHRAFVELHGLPYLLLSDPEDAAFRAFGLRRVLGMKQRATFVLDPEGIIRAAISSRLDARKHVRRALEAVQAQRFTRS